MAWQRFSVRIKGEAEPIIVKSNAWDWANAQVDPTRPMDMTFRVVHAALLRTGAEVPRDYRGFMEVLDDMPETLDDTPDGVGPMDPTNAERSDG